MSTLPETNIVPETQKKTTIPTHPVSGDMLVSEWVLHFIYAIVGPRGFHFFQKNGIIILKKPTRMISPPIKRIVYCIAWVVPLPSNSDHQDYYMFSRESL